MDLANLGIGFTDKGISQVGPILDQVTDKAAKAEKATDGLSTASNQLATSTKSGASGLSSMGKSAMSALNPLNAIRGVMAGIFAGASLAAIGQMTTDWATFNNRLMVAKVSTENMDAVQNRLIQTANSSGQAITTMGDLYSRAALSGGSLGATQEKLLQMSDGVAAALKVQGGSAESTAGAVLQMAQALSSGTVRAEEFNSMLEGAPTLLQTVANGMKSTGGSVATLRNMMLAGNLSSKQFFDAFLKGSKGMIDQASQMAVTIPMGFRTLTNGLTALIGRMDAALGVSSGIAAALQAVGEAATFVSQHIGTVGTVLASLTPAMIAAFGPAIVASVVSFAGLLGGPLLTALGGVTTAMRLFTAAVAANPIGFIAVALTTALTLMWQFRDTIMETVSGWGDFGKVAMSALNPIYDSISKMIAAAYSLGSTLYDGFVRVWNATSGVRQALSDAYDAFVKWLSPYITEGLNYLVQGLSGLLDMITSVIRAINVAVTALSDGTSADAAMAKIDGAAAKAATTIKKGHESGGKSAASQIKSAMTQGGAAAAGQIGASLSRGGGGGGGGGGVGSSSSARDEFERLNGRQSGANDNEFSWKNGGAVRDRPSTASSYGGTDFEKDDESQAWNPVKEWLVPVVERSAKLLDTMGGILAQETVDTKSWNALAYTANSGGMRMGGGRGFSFMDFREAGGNLEQFNKIDPNDFRNKGKSAEELWQMGLQLIQEMQDKKNDVTIVNQITTDSLLSAISTRAGRDAVLNVIKNSPDEVRRNLGVY